MKITKVYTRTGDKGQTRLSGYRITCLMYALIWQRIRVRLSFTTQPNLPMAR